MKYYLLGDEEYIKLTELIDFASKEDNNKININGRLYQSLQHGHWIPYEYGNYHWYKCSVCGVADKIIETVHGNAFSDKDWVETTRRYCSWCGAKMDEKKE